MSIFEPGYSAPAWLSPFADWLSLYGFGLAVIGFLMTLWVLVETLSLRKVFTLRGRTPQIRSDLQTTGKSLLSELKNWPTSKNQISALLAHCQSIVENLAKKLPRSERGSVDLLLKTLKSRHPGFLRRGASTNFDDEYVWKIYAELHGVITALEQREKDTTWE